MLTRIRKDATREDFENRNCGRFKRIFPPEDKFRREKYANLMADAFGVFLSGRANTLQQEIHRTYNNRLKVRRGYEHDRTIVFSYLRGFIDYIFLNKETLHNYQECKRSSYKVVFVSKMFA